MYDYAESDSVFMHTHRNVYLSLALALLYEGMFFVCCDLLCWVPHNRHMQISSIQSYYCLKVLMCTMDHYTCYGLSLIVTTCE